MRNQIKRKKMLHCLIKRVFITGEYILCFKENALPFYVFINSDSSSSYQRDDKTSSASCRFTIEYYVNEIFIYHSAIE